MTDPRPIIGHTKASHADLILGALRIMAPWFIAGFLVTMLLCVVL